MPKSSIDLPEILAYGGDAFLYLRGYVNEAYYEIEVPESGTKAHIYYVTVERSQEFIDFQNMFGDSIQYEKGYILQDTIFSYNLTLP